MTASSVGRLWNRCRVVGGATWFGVALFIAGAGVTALSIPLFGKTVVKDVGPGFLPVIVGLLLAFLSVVEIAASASEPRTGQPALGVGMRQVASHFGPEIQLVTLLVLYILVMNWLGFTLSTIAFFALASAIYGARKRTEMFVIAVLTSIGFFWMFVVMLSLALPRNIFGF